MVGNMFVADALVVYPAQGVGKIERIDHKTVGDLSCDFYIVRIRANNITLMVPVQNADNVGLRPLITQAAARKIMEFLQGNREQTVFTGQNWNRRFREYTGRLKSPDLAVVAAVLRELLLIGRGKELSFGERRILEQAMGLVSGEIAEVLKVDPLDLRESILSLYPPLQQEVCENA